MIVKKAKIYYTMHVWLWDFLKFGCICLQSTPDWLNAELFSSCLLRNLAIVKHLLCCRWGPKGIQMREGWKQLWICFVLMRWDESLGLFVGGGKQWGGESIPWQQQEAEISTFNLVVKDPSCGTFLVNSSSGCPLSINKLLFLSSN